MYNANRPARSELPTTKQLLKSTGIAAAVAGAILVTVVLPAEYGVDPTRIGSVLGLTEMGQIKRQLAQEAEADAARDAALAEQAATPVPATPVPATQAPAASGAPQEPSVASAGAARSDEMIFELAPNQGVEIKLTMQEGASARYTWTSSGGRINFDVHGDRPGVSYHGYGKGSSQTEEGELTAAFDGSHGWFWRNRSGAPVTITLRTEGAYTAIERVV